MKMMKKEILEDFKIEYNRSMNMIYKRHSGKGLSTSELRLLFLEWITKHVILQTTKELKKKISPNRKLSKVIQLLEHKHELPASPAEKWSFESMEWSTIEDMKRENMKSSIS